MNLAILHYDVQQYLRKNPLLSPSELALMKSPFSGLSAAELAEQLDGWRRSAKKIPLWHDTKGIYFPSKLAMEQCSSAQTARYKAGLVPPGGRGADLTGGFGVDSYYFSRLSKEVNHCEINPELSGIVQHNNRILGATNIHCLATDGIAWLRDCPEQLDYLYIDPSRRVKQKKVFTLDDAEPAIVQHQEWMLQKAPILILKAAPMLDISAALKQLLHVAEIHVVSIGNDCKELLFVQKHDHLGPALIHAVQLGNNIQRDFSFSPNDEKEANARYGPAQRYLYEPDAALLKAGCFKMPSVFYQLEKLHPNTHLYTSDRLNLLFPGRIFLVKNVMDYRSFSRNKNRVKANIAIRNFPLNTEQLRKKHGIEDGGNDYLFFVTDNHGDLKVIFTEKATPSL